MEFKDIVRQRYACRQFEDRKVPENLIQELLEMMILAPSALNLQPWKVRVVSDQKTKDELYEGTWEQAHVKTCSYLLILCADIDLAAGIDKLDKWYREIGVPDEMRNHIIGMAKSTKDSHNPEQLLCWAQRQTYIAMTTALYAANSLGLGACPMTGFNPPDFARMLKLPKHLVPCALVAVGYPAGAPGPKRRYPLADYLI